MRDRCNGVGWHHLRRKRGSFAKMRLVRKHMLEEDDRRARGLMLRTAFENMVGGATKHTAAET